MHEKQQALQRVNTAIRKIGKLTPAPARPHFTPHYPRSILGAVKIECHCGQDAFTSMGMDSHEFARFVAWVNEHARCEPKE